MLRQSHIHHVRGSRVRIVSTYASQASRAPGAMKPRAILIFKLIRPVSIFGVIDGGGSAFGGPNGWYDIWRLYQRGDEAIAVLT